LPDASCGCWSPTAVYFVFLGVAAVHRRLLPLAVAGHAGFGKANIDGAAPNEAKQILVLMNFGASSWEPR